MNRPTGNIQPLRCKYLQALGYLGVLVAAFTASFSAYAEPFVDVGLHSSRVESKVANRQDTIDVTDTGLHVGLGARRQVSEKTDLSVRIELRSINSNTLLAVRALDYRRRVNERLAVNAFLGAARLDLATPAYGYYFGGGVQFRELLPKWDLGIDIYFGDKVARDNLLPTDPQGGSPDNFHDVSGLSIYLSYKF